MQTETAKPSLVSVRQLYSVEAEEKLNRLVELLRDSVENGASVGFLPPLDEPEARAYWAEVLEEIEAGSKILLIAENSSGLILGTVQLALATRANGSHRAEVQKLMVHTEARGQGVASLLMTALEGVAHTERRSLLVLDTKQGDVAESLYAKLGYIRAGVIPHYASSADGVLYSTVFFYKWLGQTT